MSKIATVKLTDYEIVEIDGKFEKKLVSSVNVPAFLTNFSLNKAKNLGLIETDLIKDLVKMSGSSNIPELDNIIPIVYTACLGANPKFMNYEDFLSKFNYEITEMYELWAELLQTMFGDEKNKFVEGLMSGSSSKGKSGKK